MSAGEAPGKLRGWRVSVGRNDGRGGIARASLVVDAVVLEEKMKIGGCFG
jgi:hypothetical protein